MIGAGVRGARTRAWDRAWRAHGGPKATLAPAIATWTLPDGYVYDPAMDCIRLVADGSVFAGDAMSLATTVDLPYLPARTSETTQAMMVSGLLPTGSREIFVRAEDAAVYGAAWRIMIDGIAYHPQQQHISGAADSRFVLVRV